MKLVVLTNIMAPYRIPLFEALRSLVDDFSVLLMAKHEENRQWQLDEHSFKTDFLPGFHLLPSGAEVSIHINYGVIRRLMELKPDFVLSGGFSLANFAAFSYCKLFGASYVGWGELTLKDGAEASWVKRTLRRIMTRGSDGSIASSTAARDAFIHYGARPESILTTILPFDVKGLHNDTMAFKSSEIGKALRAQYPGQTVLSIGRLVKMKGCRELLAIYQSAFRANPNMQLLIIGDGPDRQSLQEEVRERGLINVHFMGHVQPRDLHKYLAIGDIFLFPTLGDTFGLVLSEAMAAELAVVSSIHAVATQDLVEDGKTGFVIDPSDTDSSGTILLKALNLSPDARARIGSAAYERVKPCDPYVAASAMVEFLYGLGSKAQ